MSELGKKLNVIKNGMDRHPLSSKYKYTILNRMIQWQLEKKRCTDGKQIEWINDRKLLIFPGRASGTGNYYYGLLEYEPMSFLFHYISKEDTFFDIGANVGVYTVLAKEAKKIVSFEPSDDTFEILSKNVKINEMDNVLLEKKGCSDSTGKVFFTTSLDSTNHIVESNDTKEDITSIDVVSLDEYVSVNGCIPTIVKIDTEGTEEKIISGAVELLKDTRLNVVIMEIFGNKIYTDLLKKHGFELYSYNPEHRQLIKRDTEEVGDNGIYIRDINLATSKVKSGKSILYCGDVLA